MLRSTAYYRRTSGNLLETAVDAFGKHVVRDDVAYSKVGRRYRQEESLTRHCARPQRRGQAMDASSVNLTIVLILAVLVIVFLLYFVPLGLWITAIFSGARRRSGSPGQS